MKQNGQTKSDQTSTRMVETAFVAVDSSDMGLK